MTGEHSCGVTCLDLVILIMKKKCYVFYLEIPTTMTENPET